ncbi:MAG: N-acetylmannosamine-6-phosphate 2-epimerase [Alicyclobacillus sp.]|nr:N-acetylmannosamine-6-phosphate 2-epimerase [Alicyclobacillus sp.]
MAEISPVLQQIRGGLIVSCQAQKQDPLFGSEMMARMAMAAKMGGAVAIRANGGEDIRAIKRAVELPVIGIVKRTYDNSPVYITPTLREVNEVYEAGADIVAVDGTRRVRPDGSDAEAFIRAVKEKYPDVLVMADVSTVEEGEAAAAAGADLVASTMSGYTEYSPQLEGPDLQLVADLAARVAVPVIAEGRIRTPDQALECLNLGAWAVVVGTAITRPQEITRWFAKCLRQTASPGT